ncbi:MULTISPECIES: ATP-binding protein [unclassified Snodgrassella]|uniref:ATP-binding protein n=1 Tax=unclassified Snodgrassella TaxID=2625236 RepID=UPI0018DB42C2|nr:MULTISPECIES: ATP-binding protein [Snodgrassella]MBI0067010.1 ATP-binding protein [Snodgrassella sp. M0110]
MLDTQIEMEEFSSEIYQLEKLSNKLKSTQFNLIDYPYLVIYGDAGIGKSHLLGDFANHLIL